jgi:hypothetical protein
MAIELLFNKTIQIIFFWTKFKFWKKKTIVYIIEGNLWINFHFDKLSIRYELSNLRFYIMFKWNMILIK